jgi:hypothetical protein
MYSSEPLPNAVATVAVQSPDGSRETFVYDRRLTQRQRLLATEKMRDGLDNGSAIRVVLRSEIRRGQPRDE